MIATGGDFIDVARDCDKMMSLESKLFLLSIYSYIIPIKPFIKCANNSVPISIDLEMGKKFCSLIGQY